MSEINSKDNDAKLSPKELYEKYKGFPVITKRGTPGIIVGYVEECDACDDYELIASAGAWKGWRLMNELDIIPDHKGEEEDRSFLYASREGIVK